MKNKKLYLKIIGVIVISFIVVKLGSNEIFIANTPKIRPDIFARVNVLISNNIGFIAQLFNKNNKNLAEVEKRRVEEYLKDIPLKIAAKGIYAKSRGNMSYTLIKENEVEWIVYTFNIKGKEIKIKVPKGQSPPSQDLLEKIY